MNDINRQISGKRSNVAGAMFENMLSASCSYYREKNVAIIEKTPELFRKTGTTGLQRGAV